MAGKNEVKIIISAVDNASKILKKSGLSLDGLGKIAKVAAAATAAAAVAIGVGMLKLAKDAAPVEGITKAFKGLTKEIVGGSEEMLKSLRMSSLGMVTNTDLMKSFNTAAQLVSMDFAQKLPDAMGYLSKVSAATGQDLDFMMESLVKGIGRLSPMILDNLGIQVDVTQAYEDFAQANGLVASELSKTEQQTALMNQVLEKLKENTAAMPEVAGSATQSFAALGVKFQNIKEEVGLALLPALVELADKLMVMFDNPKTKIAIDTLIGWIGGIAGALEGIIDLVNWLTTALQSLEARQNSISRWQSNAAAVQEQGSTKKSWGFASGGSFTVPGSGSGDRPYIVPLTPGENVTVTPVGQAVDSNGSRVNSNTFSVYGDLVVNGAGDMSTMDVLADIRL